MHTDLPFQLPPGIQLFFCMEQVGGREIVEVWGHMILEGKDRYERYLMPRV